MRKLAALFLLAGVAGCRPEAVHSAAVRPARSATTPPTRTVVGTDPGNSMPAYAAKFLNGKPFDLAGEKGSVIFLNVWATWCGPCRFEIPELQALHEKYAAHGFKVIGISVDETGADAVAQFVKDNKMTYPIVLDPEGKIANILRTTVIPTSVIIGRDGRVIYREVGAVMPNEISTVDVVVERALTGKS